MIDKALIFTYYTMAQTEFYLPIYKKIANVFLITLATTLFTTLTDGKVFAKPIIGIFGDVHGNEPGMLAALTKMKALGVTHIIGTGDFIGWGNAAELDKLLSLIETTTAVSSQNTYLMPGNWEHEASIGPVQANEVLRSHGNLICERYDGYGIIKIDEITIMVSHFPQHPIPEQYIPPKEFLRRIIGQAFVLDTMKYNVYPPEGAEFEIFAHNHIRTAYVDPVSNRMVINAGVIDAKTRKPTEQRAFAIFDGNTKDIIFYSVEDGNIIATANTRNHSITSDVIEGLKGCEVLRRAFEAL